MDLLFWIEYEELLLRVAIDPPSLADLVGMFQVLADLLEDDDNKAICYRNIGLIRVKLGQHSEALEAFDKARKLSGRKYLKLQNTLMANAEGELVELSGLFSPAEGTSDDEKNYLKALGQRFLTVEGGVPKAEESVDFLVEAL